MSQQTKNPSASGSRNSSRKAAQVLYLAAAVIDHRGIRGRALLVGFDAGPLPRVLAVGSEEEVRRHPAAARALEVHLGHTVVIPGLVNAHTHLDLTHIGPRTHNPEDGFVPWVHMIRSERRLDAEGVAASVQRGIDLSLAGGTVAVGDIAGALPGDADGAAWRAAAASPLLGVSYQEFFGIGTGVQAGRERMWALAAPGSPTCTGQESSIAVRMGLQPHAPFTVAREVYLEAAALAAANGIPIATHAAETPEEHLLVGLGNGPYLDLLKGLGIWTHALAATLGRGLHPVEHIEAALSAAPFVLAHVNDAPDRVIEILARSGATVVYCPRASEYFGAAWHFGPHRYREMLSAGVNVALGTDSIVNLPAGTAHPAQGGMSVLDEMRLLHRRDGMDPLRLLEMATTRSARALGIEESWVRFSARDELAGAVAVPLDTRGDSDTSTDRGLLERVLRSDAAPGLLFIRNQCCNTGISRPPGGLFV